MCDRPIARAHSTLADPRELTMETTHEVSSGNVFADLSFPNSEQELVEAKLTVQIYQILKNQELTQSEAARLLGTTQAQISALMRCCPVSISVGRLMELLVALGQDVEVRVGLCVHQGTGQMAVTVGPAGA
jgi:predicted XRE-type DNA-binding protein